MSEGTVYQGAPGGRADSGRKLQSLHKAATTPLQDNFKGLQAAPNYQHDSYYYTAVIGVKP